MLEALSPGCSDVFVAVSGGALAACLCICDIRADDVVRYVFSPGPGDSTGQVHRPVSTSIFGAHGRAMQIIDEMLPDDAHIRCTGRLLIAYVDRCMRVRYRGTFGSRSELLSTMCDTTSLPVDTGFVRRLLCRQRPTAGMDPIRLHRSWYSALSTGSTQRMFHGVVVSVRGEGSPFACIWSPACLDDANAHVGRGRHRGHLIRTHASCMWQYSVGATDHTLPEFVLRTASKTDGKFSTLHVSLVLVFGVVLTTIALPVATMYTILG